MSLLRGDDLQRAVSLVEVCIFSNIRLYFVAMREKMVRGKKANSTRALRQMIRRYWLKLRSRTPEQQENDYDPCTRRIIVWALQEIIGQ